MKRRSIKALCIATAIFLILSGCGTELGGQDARDGADVGVIKEAAPDGANDETAPESGDAGTGHEAAPDGTNDGTVPESGDAGMDGETAQDSEDSGTNGEAAPEGENAGTDGGEMGSGKQALAGKTLSILGDSISTFRGYNLEGYAVFFPDFGEITAVEDTWWQRVVNDLGLTLSKNGSSSGATVAGDSTGTDDPACACNELRTGALAGADGACPELIIVYLGTNDMIEAVPLGNNDGTAAVQEGEITTFSDAYTLMLDKLQAKYPQARIYCCTLLPVGNYGTNTPFVEWVNGIGLTSADYSGAIVQISENKGLSVVDLQNCGVTIDNLAEMSTDGVHPKPAGMACIAEAVRKTLEAN